ncbi:MAG: zf-HC2 domain-containing protein [Gemmatimonadota bacterium]|jgi:hypothetical protein
MTGHLDEGLLNDFREGLLKPEERNAVRGHLERCSRCRAGLGRLSKLADEMAALPQEAEPPRDLWPQIAWRMERSGLSATTPSISTEADQALATQTPRTGLRRGWRVSLPAWQLLAASIALMVISGATVWAFLSEGMNAGPVLDPSAAQSAQWVGWEEAYGGYDEAVADLEAVLEKGREILDPETVKVLEESLQAIDLAIDEAEAAVREDPASPVLQRFLAENLRKKMDLLRRAAAAVYANT